MKRCRVIDAFLIYIRLNKRLLWIDKLLDENFNYSLLADIHHYKMIILPNYELIVVKCKRETAKDDFRKLIPSIVQKEKRLIESLETKKNGQIVNYRYALVPF